MRSVLAIPSRRYPNPIASTRRAGRESGRPRPLIELRLIDAMLVSVVLAVDLHIAQDFFGVGASHLQCRHPVNNVDRQTETINLVLDSQIERCIDVSFFLVTTYVQVLVIRAPVGQAMNQPGI